jgi:hypothetical protein
VRLETRLEAAELRAKENGGTIAGVPVALAELKIQMTQVLLDVAVLRADADKRKGR